LLGFEEVTSNVNLVKEKKIIGIFENKKYPEMCNLYHFSPTQSPQMLSWLKYKRWSENRNILVPGMATFLEIGLRTADMQDWAAIVGKSNVTRSF